MVKTGSFFVVLLATLLAATTLDGKTWFVDGGVATSGTGASWGSPFKTIQEAVDAASGWPDCLIADSIWVKAGTYVLSKEIAIGKRVALYGGFDGSETALETRNWETNLTTIDGNNAVRCLSLTANCTVDGFTVKNGKESSGAGIKIQSPPATCRMGPAYVLTARVIIRNSTIVANATTGAGGGIYDDSSSPLIEGCRFSRNTADRGGAIFAWGSKPDIEECSFHANETTSKSSWGGGAILGDAYSYGTITNCLFAGNVSASTGGAISLHISHPVITNCTLADNIAATSGGAVYLNVSHPGLKNCILWGDTPDELAKGAGVIDPTISYSDVEGGYSGTGNIDADPLFYAATYRPVSSSPCIDAGSNASAPAVDLEGDSRPVDGNGDGAAVTDLGAFEHP